MGEPTSTLSVSLFLKMAAMAMFASIIHAMQQYRTGGSKNRLDLFILASISFFFGIVSGLLVHHLVGEQPMLFGIIGVSGWLGIEMSSVLTNFIKSKFK